MVNSLIELIKSVSDVEPYLVMKHSPDEISKLLNDISSELFPVLAVKQNILCFLLNVKI